MKSAALFTTLITIIAVTACGLDNKTIDGNGQLKTENRPVNQTEKIRLLGGLDVFVVSGTPGIRVEADENLLQFIETNEVNGWLEIKTKDHFNINSSNAIRVYVTTERISDLSITGSGNITCNNKFVSGNKASFNVTGSGNLIARINAPFVVAEVTGSGNLEITGETKDVEVEIEGSGNFRGRELKAENAKIDIAGSGNAYVFADDNLEADIAGSGIVRYSGKASVKSDVAGSGSVIRIE